MQGIENDGPNWSLLETLRKSDLPDLIAELGEVGLDRALSDGILKEIPIIGSVIGVGKTFFSVRNYLLIRKIQKFLTTLEEVTLEERQSFLHRIESDEGHGRQVGDLVITYLDRFDDVEKALLMSKVFCAYCRELIDFPALSRLSASIDRANILDLRDMFAYMAQERPNEHEVRRNERNLFSSDLSDFYVLTGQEYKRSGLEHPQVYGFNPQARLLSRLVLGDRYRGDR